LRCGFNRPKLGRCHRGAQKTATRESFGAISFNASNPFLLHSGAVGVALSHRLCVAAVGAQGVHI